MGGVKRRHRLRKNSIWCVTEHILWIVFKLNICTNPYTHNKTNETNKGQHTSEIQTSERNISLTKRTISKILGEPFHGRYKLENHADTTVSGKNCTIIKYIYWSCDVAPLLEKLTPMKGTPIVSGATGFKSANGINYILVFRAALYIPDMRHNLINSNQFRHFEAKLQDNH